MLLNKNVEFENETLNAWNKKNGLKHENET